MIASTPRPTQPSTMPAMAMPSPFSWVSAVVLSVSASCGGESPFRWQAGDDEVDLGRDGYRVIREAFVVAADQRGVHRRYDAM